MKKSFSLNLIFALFLLLVFTVSTNATELVFLVHESESFNTPYSALSFQKNGDRWYDSEYWTGPDWTRVGRHWHHPGNQTDAIRTFIAPADGKIKITGPVKKLHCEGDGVVVSIMHNDKKLWSDTLEGNDAVGKNPELQITVKENDSIRFIVNRRGSIACDTTGWEPVITYLDSGKTYSATDAFGTTQGNNGWFYEMEETRAPETRFSLKIHLDETVFQEICGDYQRFPDSEMLKVIITDWLQEDRFFRANSPVPWESAAPWVARPKEHLDAAVVYQATSENLSRCIRERFNQIARLIADYRSLGYGEYDAERQMMHELLEKMMKPNLSERDWQILYLRTRLLKRELFFSQPKFDFNELLFVKRRPPSYSHLVGQYFGWRQQPGGGIFVLEKPGYSIKHRNLLGDKLPPGNVLEPRLSYDAKRIAFSHVAVPPEVPDWLQFPVNEDGTNEYYYHLYEMKLDGSEFRQLTDGCYDDMMPEYLPDGDLAFVSTRRKAYSRCFGPNFSRRWHSYTLHRLNKDSGEIFPISFNDVNDWFPAVGNDGSILFARWDYIDRDAVTHQNLWAVRPDGTNPRAVWGNAVERPHCTFQPRPIPDSNKIMFIASAHHSITAGPVCIVDPVVDANSLDAVTRLTPEPFPEAESWDIPQYYNSPWPLSENLFLVAFSHDRLIFEPAPNIDNALGLYLMDDQGNREILYRDPDIGSTCPIPIAARPLPPVLSAAIDPSLAEEELGEMSIADVYEGLGNVERGSLKELRIVQIFPKSSWIVNEPRIGSAGEENARAILGVVPIEKDGSAKFLVPSGKPILFQVLDADGFAYQTMRSTTSVMPGEQVSCVGCHEDRMHAPRPRNSTPLAFARPASRIKSTWDSGRPYGFVEMVQPVLDSKCVSCHGGTDESGKINLSGKLDLTRTIEGEHTRSYRALCPTEEHGYLLHAQDPTKLLVPRFVERNQIQATVPGGAYGARGSRLIKLLQDGHEGVVLTPQELKNIITWIDLNAVFYGDYDSKMIERQRLGHPIPMPLIQ